jgi:hypothetical protein
VTALGGLATALAWPFLPYTDIPAFNLRYAFVALVAGSVLLAIHVRREWAFVALAFVAMLHVDRPGTGYRGPAAEVVRPLAALGRTLHDERIGIEGGEIQYPLYGRDLSNHVQYVGEELPDGGFARIGSCQAWRRAVNAGRYDRLVLMPAGALTHPRPQPSPRIGWTESDPAARVTMRLPRGVVVLTLDGPLDPAAC